MSLRVSRSLRWGAITASSERFRQEGSMPTQESILVKPAKKNSHVTEYLEYYLSLPSPNFAVLINGDWGVGKTYLVKTFLKTWKSDRDYLYVSLYGVKTLEDIDTALLEATFAVGMETAGVKGASAILAGLRDLPKSIPADYSSLLMSPTTLSRPSTCLTTLSASTQLSP